VLALLEDMLDSGITPEEACRDCPDLLPQVKERWRGFCQVDEALGAIFPGLHTPTVADTAADVAITAGLPQIPGYSLEEVLGYGGMGVVYRARQKALDRVVAVKTLLAGPFASPLELGRFRRETSALASVKHPNIVQVYDAGDVDGRPYLTMELIEGGTLARKLAGAPLSARDAANLVATLAGAVDVAHQAGIVHRDLKPVNILLAADGTPKIADFGLARRVEGDGALTQTGVAVGTPNYMAPEQTGGQARAIGPAVDVYALGAILYETLTGRPPFRADTPAKTILQVIHEDPVAPSRSNTRIPRDLETICLKCLQKHPGKRYTTAAQLAADLGRFLSHEPIRARPVGRVEHTLRWVRRRPTAAGLIATVTLLLLVGGVGAGLQYRQWIGAQERQEQTDREVRGVLTVARGPLKDGWTAQDLTTLTAALAEGNRAVDIARSGAASAAVRQEADAFRADAVERLGRAKKNRDLLEALLDVPGLQETGDFTYDKPHRMMNLAQPSLDEQYAAAFRLWGLEVDGTAEDQVVARLRAEPDAVVDELIAALDSWMLERRRRKSPEAGWRRLFRLAERLDRSERHRRLRTLLVGESPARAASVAELQEARKNIDLRTEPVLTVVLLAQAYATVGDAAGAERILREAVVARPDQVVLLDTLGNMIALQGPSRIGQAIEYYRAARAQRPRLGIALGEALICAGRAEEGERVLRELIRQQPGKPALYSDLGVSLDDQRKYGEAEAAYRKAIELRPDYAGVHYNLGIVLLEQKKPGAAEAPFRKAIELQPDFAHAYFHLGVILNDEQKKPAAAEAAFRKVIERQPDNALAHVNLGVSLNDQEKHGAAEAAIRKAIELQPDNADAHLYLGNALIRQKKYAAAEAALRKAINLRPKFADAYVFLGISLNDQEKHGAAEAALRKAIEFRPDSAKAYYNLGNALSCQKKYAAAETAIRKAIDLQPNFPEAYYNLGNALSYQDKHGAAEAVYRKVIDLQPESAKAHNNLGMALRQQQKHGAAEAAFRKAIELQPDGALAHCNLALELMEQARFDEAVAFFNKGNALLPAGDPVREETRPLVQQCQRYVSLDARLAAVLRGAEKPADAAEQIEFARLCALKKLHAAAARFYEAAFAAEPKLAQDVSAGTRYNAACAAALAGCGQGKDADQLDDSARARCRRQARERLRQDLTWLSQSFAVETAEARAQVVKILRYWKTDDNLAGLRDPSPLGALPADERQECRTLWEEVAAVLDRARAIK
jgi:serine/threonine-protein kinase